MFPNVVHGNVAFIMLATVLVFIMTPGLAFFYGGLVGKRNTLTIMLQIFLSIGIVTVMWFLFGFSMVFGTDINGVIGNPFNYFALKGVVFSVNSKYGLTIPFLSFCMYQLMFAIITLPLMTGTIVNRIRISSWIKFLIIWMILIYFPVAHWVWGGGFLSKLGFVDFAGGTVIHATSAFSGLAAVLILGKREINDKKPFNLGLVSIGSALLMFGWFGFNAGGTLVAAEKAAIVFANTCFAGASAMITWSIVAYMKDKHFSFLEPLVGTVAGLATITPASGYVNPIGAIIIGIIAGFACFFCVQFIRKLDIDDTLDVLGVHGFGGFIGTLFIGIFADKYVNEISANVHQILIQLFGVCLVIVYSMVITFIIVKVLDKTCSNFRLTKEELEKGLDESLLNESYDIAD
ncbi:ammonium transporter [Clostridium perfringens]|uniref:Ammonium transporter n=1 Tax=Clostridium perfringens E str. JGS1987 TaxID=451755 RepID=B1BU47_CLOPF|nr:ammonium transporter [Clostridium perfringens E str. JGS1987]